MKSHSKSRREFLKTTALSAAILAAPPFVRTSHAAGSLSVAFADHWVPGANEVLKGFVDEWAAANKVDVTLDFITTEGFKDIVTATAEAQAKTGHDLMSHPTWQVAVHQNSLEVVDDVVKEMTAKYGEYNPNAKYLARFDGQWYAVPTSVQDQSFPMVTRMDIWKEHAGIDVKQIFPASPNRDKAAVAAWTYENFLEGAKKVHKAGKGFGNPIGQTGDSQMWLGALLKSFGSSLVDENGEITVDTDATRAAIEFMRELVQYMPPDVYGWDDGSNNRWIISGKGSAIQNPPSVWAVARRDAPQVAEQLWHHDCPAGPAGRYRGHWPYFWGIWKFAKNKSAAKELILYLQEKERVAKLVKASAGYDMAPLPSFRDIPVWNEEKPPAGTLYNYMLQGDETLFIAGYPAPPVIAANIFNQGTIPVMVAKVTQGGESVDDVIAWAEEECEGFLRR